MKKLLTFLDIFLPAVSSGSLLHTVEAASTVTSLSSDCDIAAGELVVSGPRFLLAMRLRLDHVEMGENGSSRTRSVYLDTIRCSDALCRARLDVIC